MSTRREFASPAMDSRVQQKGQTQNESAAMQELSDDRNTKVQPDKEMPPPKSDDEMRMDNDGYQEPYQK